MFKTNQTKTSQSILLGLIASTLMALAGCAQEPQAQGCSEHSDCPYAMLCDIQGNTGICICNTDDQCGEGQYCNTFSSCQERPTCLGNQDCGVGEICSTVRGEDAACIPQNTCGWNVHCDLNHRCQIDTGTTGTCVPGCDTTDDCQLGSICFAGECVAGNCEECPVNPSPDPSYCDYGDACAYDQPTNSYGCAEHPDKADLCASCGFDIDSETCPTGLVCLVDHEEADAGYCTTTCRNSGDCPNGFGECGSITLVGPACTGNSGCTEYNGFCVQGAETEQGHCSYGDSSFCPELTCSGNECGIAIELLGVQIDFISYGLPCSANADCAVVHQPFGDGRTDGYCQTQIGVCGKESGLTCDNASAGNGICYDL